MPIYVIEFGKFARFEGGDARGKGGTLVTRKRGDLIELSLEQAEEKYESIRLATPEEIAAGRALSMQMNPLPIPQPVNTQEPEPAADAEPPTPVEPVAPAPPAVPAPVPPPPPPAAPPAAPTKSGNEQTPKPRESKKTAKKKTAGKRK